MKNPSCRAYLAAIIGCMVVHPASATDLYFDASPASGLTPGAAAWDAGASAAWADSPAPATSTPTTWLDGSDAFFQTGGTSTVTLSGTVTDVSITHANGTTATDGTVSKTGSGDLTLTLQGTSAFGTIRNSSTIGILTLTTPAAADEVSTSLRSVLGSSMSITSGIWNALNLGVNGTGNQMRGTLSISSASVIVANGRYATGNLDILAGGTLRVTGDRLGFNTDQNVPSATIRILNDGLLEVYSTQYGTTLGGDFAVDLRQGFVPAQTDVFTVLTAGSLGGAFSNVASGGRLTCSPTHGSFLVTITGTGVVLSDYQPDLDAGPEIAHAPLSTGTLAGQEVYLSVVATGDGPLGYQWRKDGVAIAGATEASYIVANAAPADAGSYDVVVTDATGSKTTPAADLAVSPAGSIDPLVAASAYANQSLWSYHDSVLVPWSLFKARDYGSSQITFDGQGVTPLGRVPAPGVHPRLFFSSEDLPALRQRIQTTTGGQEAWKNLLSYCHVMKRTYDKNQDYAKPWWYVNYFGFTGRNPNIYRINGVGTEDYYTILANGGTPASFASEPSFFFKAASMEALRCLIEEDSAGGEKLARAVVRTIQIEQARRAVADAPSNPPKPSTPRANCSSLGLVYDFAYNFMTPEQQDFVRQELVLLSAWADNYGTFNNAEASRSNWATFSYWVFDLMAIEGEPGFNDLKFLGLYRGWRNYFTYSFFDSGAAFEAEGKLPLGFDAMMAFDRVGWKYGLAPLSHHPMVRSYCSKFLPFSVLPARNNQFVIFDILGSLGGALTTPADLVAAKFLYPNDRLVDFSYRSLVKDNYSNIPSAIHFHWNEQAVSAITATSYDPANDPVSLNTPLSFFCGQRAMMMTRSSWDADASFLTMHVRGASGGHPYPDRNGIMFAGMGRSWITIPGKDIGGWAMNTVLIDEAQQSSTTPARVVDYVDQPAATFMVGDAKYSWDWVWGTSTEDKQGGSINRDDVLNANVNTGASGWSLVDQCFNDFAYDQSSRPVYNEPLKFCASWIAKDGILEPYKRMVNSPVLKSFRSAGLIRGPRPYALVVDDIQRDSMSASYDWNATLPADVVKVTSSLGQAGDVILAGSAGLNPDGSLKSNEPALLVRTLTAMGQVAVPSVVTRNGFKHFQIRTTATAPDFKILIHAFRMGETLPVTTWDGANTTLAVSFPNQSDTISFTPAASGKTDIVVSRGGSALASVNRPVVPLDDPASTVFTASLQGVQTRVSQLRTQNYNPSTRPGFLAGWDFDRTQEVAGIGPAFIPVAGSIPRADPIPAIGLSQVSGMHGGSATSLSTPGINTPLDWGSQLVGSFTIAFWMKMNVIENDKTFFDFGGNRVLLLRQRNGSLNLAALNNWYLDAGPSPMLTSWTHLVAVFTGSQLQIYRDGFLVSSYAATPANFSAFASMKLGVMNGAVQSARFYNTGFSADDVCDLYLWGKFGASASQIALPDPLESWRQSHFGITPDSGIAANDVDHDGDGLVNLMEYALGGNPIAANDAPRPVLAMADGSPQMLHYSFTRLRSDLTYIVEGSPDLEFWETLDTNPGNVGETVNFEIPTTSDHRFLRLRVISGTSTPEIH